MGHASAGGLDEFRRNRVKGVSARKVLVMKLAKDERVDHLVAELNALEGIAVSVVLLGKVNFAIAAFSQGSAFVDVNWLFL